MLFTAGSSSSFTDRNTEIKPTNTSTFQSRLENTLPSRSRQVCCGGLRTPQESYSKGLGVTAFFCLPFDNLSRSSFSTRRASRYPGSLLGLDISRSTSANIHGRQGYNKCWFFDLQPKLPIYT